MSLTRILSGIGIMIMSIFLAKFGEMDDAPGAVLIAIIFFAFGLYLIIKNKKKIRKKLK